MRRYAIARFFQETNAISPVPTEAEDFARFEYVGEDLAERCRPEVEEIPGIWRQGELTGFVETVAPGATIVPLWGAFAIPGGKVRRSVFDRYVDRLIAAWHEAEPCDALFLSLHGAMGVDGLDDAEGELLRQVRDAIGEVPLVVSFDMHGFLTPQRVAAVDGLVGYRTFPHRDHRQTGQRAGRLLQRIVAGARPTHAFRSLPMILGGYPNLDFWRPMAALFSALRRIEQLPGVLTATLLTCQPWHDAPSLGWSVIVTTDGDRALADLLADELADLVWSVRDRVPPSVGSVDEALDRVVRARWRAWFGTQILSDTSDAVGAGGVGENTAILDALRAHPADLRAAVPLRDAVAVEALWSKPVGATFELEVGGRLAPHWYPSTTLSGTVVSHHPTTLLGGRSVVVRSGPVHVVLTADTPIALGPKFFRHVGLRPRDQDVCVVKSWVAFQFYFALHNRQSHWVRTRGVTDLEALRTLSFDVPVHPLVEVDDWRPADRIRRGLTP